jgi:hypothetical protein
MPDTAANQAAYPQSRGQKPGLGFPICRLVGIVCLSSGAVLNAALGRFRGKGGDEQTLLRSMLDTLNAGDVLVGDAYCATYFLLCELQPAGIDGVFEQYGARRRRTDFRRGKRRSSNDPYGGIAYAETCASIWGSNLVNIGDAGHINASSGLGAWREGHDFLQELLT